MPSQGRFFATGTDDERQREHQREHQRHERFLHSITSTPRAQVSGRPITYCPVTSRQQDWPRGQAPASSPFRPHDGPSQVYPTERRYPTERQVRPDSVDGRSDESSDDELSPLVPEQQHVFTAHNMSGTPLPENRTAGTGMQHKIIRILICIFAVICGVLVMPAPGTYHPAWVTVKTTNQSIHLSLRDPLDSLQTEYERSLIPLVYEMQVNSPIPQDPGSVIAAIEQEFHEIKHRVRDWHGHERVEFRSKAGDLSEPHGRSVSEKVQFCLNHFSKLQKDWRSLDKEVERVVATREHGGLGSWLQELIEDEDTNQDSKTVLTIDKFISHLSTRQKRNNQLLRRVRSINDKLRDIEADITIVPEQTLHVFRTGFQNSSMAPHLDDSIDAAEFLLEHLAPLVPLIRRHFDAATVTLASANATLTQHLTYYSQLRSSFGRERHVVIATITNETVWWSTSFFDEHRITIKYRLMRRTATELFIIGDRASDTRVFLDRETSRDYKKIRPLRPSDKEWLAYLKEKESFS